MPESPRTLWLSQVNHSHTPHFGYAPLLKIYYCYEKSGAGPCDGPKTMYPLVPHPDDVTLFGDVLKYPHYYGHSVLFVEPSVLNDPDAWIHYDSILDQ